MLYIRFKFFWHVLVQSYPAILNSLARVFCRTTLTGYQASYLPEDHVKRICW